MIFEVYNFGVLRELAPKNLHLKLVKVTRFYCLFIGEKKFAKLRAMCGCMPTWSTCKHACKPALFTCQWGFAPVTNCLCANVPGTCHPIISTFKRANKPPKVSHGVPMFQYGVPPCQTVCQFFNLACQCAQRMPIFQTFLL